MTYRSECEGKVRFLSRKFAKQAIPRMRGRDHERRLNAYRCSWCPFWHIGRWHPNVREHQRNRTTTLPANKENR